MRNVKLSPNERRLFMRRGALAELVEARQRVQRLERIAGVPSTTEQETAADQPPRRTQTRAQRQATSRRMTAFWAAKRREKNKR